MKTKFFFLLMICIFANFLSAQTLVKPADFKLTEIASYLKTSGYKILEQEESFIKISDKQNASMFIDLDSDKKYLLFNVKIMLRKDVKVSQIENLVAQINDLKMIKAKYLSADNTVFFQYYFWIKDGFTKETFNDAVLEFFLYQGDSFALDTDKIFVYQ